MGREALVDKPRKCKICGDISYCTALEHLEHSTLCKSAKDAGLILGGTRIIVP